MSGQLGASCRPLAASCTSHDHRILGTDDLKVVAFCRPSAARCTFNILRLVSTYLRPLNVNDMEFECACECEWPFVGKIMPNSAKRISYQPSITDEFAEQLPIRFSN